MVGHVTCAICGVLASTMYWRCRPDEPIMEERGVHGIRAISQKEFLWLADVRILGQDTREGAGLASSERAFLSGEALDLDYGSYTLPEGQVFPDGRTAIRTQVNNGDPQDRFAFPLHSQCYDQLCLAFSPQAVDLDILFAAFKSLDPQAYGMPLKLDYGADRTGMHRMPVLGTHDFATAPSSDPALKQYYLALINNSPPAQEGRAVVDSRIRPASEGTCDPFSSIGTELLLCIMDFLDTPSVCRWRESSRSVAALTLGNGFWKSRICHEMPWLYDFPITTNAGIDWLSLHEALDRASSRPKKMARQLELRRLSRPAVKPSGRQVQRLDANSILDWSDMNAKLMNRRRIWGVVDQVLERYGPLKVEKDRAREDKALVSAGAS